MGAEKGDRAKTLLAGLEAILKQPELLGMPDKDGNYLDPHEFLKEILRDSDVKDVSTFYRKAAQAMAQAGAPGGSAPNVQVMPDEEIAKQRDAGNIIPMQGGMAA